MKKRLQQHGEVDRDEEYHLTIDGLVRFKNKIYLPNSIEIKKLISRKFHFKPYSDHLGYKKSLKFFKKFYHWPKLKKEVVAFVVRCLNC